MVGVSVIPATQEWGGGSLIFGCSLAVPQYGPKLSLRIPFSPVLSLYAKGEGRAGVLVRLVPCWPPPAPLV